MRIVRKPHDTAVRLVEILLTYVYKGSEGVTGGVNTANGLVNVRCTPPVVGCLAECGR